MATALLVMLILFALLAIIGLPLSFATGLSAISYFLISGRSLNTVIHTFYNGVNVVTLMAIPLFIFAGSIMAECKITDSIINLSNLLVGRIRGGLAHVNILASMFFGGCSGSALSDVAGLGSVLIPAMKKNGYSEEFSAAVTVSSSVQGPIIPPSIPMVLFASVAQVSTGALLVGGAIPGILLGIMQMVVVYWLAKKRNYGKSNLKFTKKDVKNILKESIPALLMPLILMSGILFGVFTPTEAAAVAVGYALIIGFFVYKNLTIKTMLRVCGKVAADSASIFLLIGTAGIFGWILAVENAPQVLAEAIRSTTTNPYLILLIINVVLLFWGMIMDAAPAILLLGPLLTPLAESVGINPIHFGVVMVFNLMIGLMTPPYGLCLFSATAICDSSIGKISKEIIPFLLISIFVLFIITYIPQIVLWLPKIAGFLD